MRLNQHPEVTCMWWCYAWQYSSKQVSHACWSISVSKAGTKLRTGKFGTGVKQWSDRTSTRTCNRDTQDDPSCSMYKITLATGEERKGGETRAEGGGQEWERVRFDQPAMARCNGPWSLQDPLLGPSQRHKWSRGWLWGFHWGDSSFTLVLFWFFPSWSLFFLRFVRFVWLRRRLLSSRIITASAAGPVTLCLRW